MRRNTIKLNITNIERHTSKFETKRIDELEHENVKTAATFDHVHKAITKNIVNLDKLINDVPEDTKKI